jgi:hypothetical protein
MHVLQQAYRCHISAGICRHAQERQGGKAQQHHDSVQSGACLILTLIAKLIMTNVGKTNVSGSTKLTCTCCMGYLAAKATHMTLSST